MAEHNTNFNERQKENFYNNNEIIAYYFEVIK